ncbi:MAG: DUF2442 domain-containing protein [Cytophagales bacterium]|nr:DUF2442 domain-containing protein [Cytophagales bacterium]
MEGIIDTKPVINTIKFTKKGKMDVYLQDGRIITVPLKYFPSIQKLNANQRKQLQIINDVAFTFIDSHELYHIEDVMGNYNNYKYDF